MVSTVIVHSRVVTGEEYLLCETSGGVVFGVHSDQSIAGL